MHDDVDEHPQAGATKNNDDAPAIRHTDALDIVVVLVLVASNSRVFRGDRAALAMC